MNRSYINKGDNPTKTGFGEGLVESGMRNQEVIVLGADITASVGVNLFAEKFPHRFFSLGIAEQNGAGVAAGLALEGKIPVFATYAVFSALRTTDQLRVSICYNRVHAIIGGAHAGVSVGPDGATHQALEDLAIMRSLPHMTVLSPCDATQTKIATIQAILQLSGPVYIRFGREAMPDFTDEKQRFTVGKAQVMKKGKDITIIATGHLVWEALQAAYSLKEQGIDARVLNMHTIKPVDREAIVCAAQETGAIVSAEEHQITGGLGSAIAEVVTQEYPVPMKFIGMPDTFGESGEPYALMKKYGLTDQAIMTAVTSLLNER